MKINNTKFWGNYGENRLFSHDFSYKVKLLWCADPLLSRDSNQRPFLDNDAVNTLSQQRLRTQK
jgi:hypothetical protein